jgi:hypothetical protein
MDIKLLKKIFFDFFIIDKIDYGKCKILTIAHDTDRGYIVDGKYYSPLVDTIEDKLAENNLKCISIARIISSIKGDLSYANVQSPDGRFARALLVKRIKGFLFKNKYAYSNLEEKIWTDILVNTGAQKVIGIMPSRELCVACKKRGVWVADIQHGVIAHNHPWYGKKFRSIDPIEQLPNGFLVWDEGSAEVLRNWVDPSKVEVKVIGNRWLERFKNPNPADSIVNKSIEIFDKFISNKQNGRKVILISLSWGQVGLENGIMPETLINIIKKTSDKFMWLLRLHPNQLKGFATNESEQFFKLYNEKLLGFAEWEIPSYSPLPSVLKYIDLHIAWNSSVVMEAAQFGVRSAALDPRLRGEFINDYYDFYKRNGYIDFIENDEEILINWIHNNISYKMDDNDFENENIEYRKFISFLIEN